MEERVFKQAEPDTEPSALKTAPDQPRISRNKAKKIRGEVRTLQQRAIRFEKRRAGGRLEDDRMFKACETIRQMARDSGVAR